MFFFLGLRCEQLLLGVLDCLFNAVFGLDVAEEKFLELEGAFLLIDLLEKVPHQMHQVEFRKHTSQTNTYRCTYTCSWIYRH